jgi:haloacetate dehalogenase
LTSWTRAQDLSPFGRQALAHYRAFFSVPERLAATCEDYRAGATIDRTLDEADLAGRRRIDVPTLVLWGNAGIPAGPTGSDPAAGPLAAWKPFMAEGTPLSGEGIDAGHFVAEEAPEKTARALLAFL